MRRIRTGSSRADIEIRRLWDKFESVYEDCLSATSSKVAPWYAVPADEKRNTRLIVSQIIVETMKTLSMDYPVADKRHLKELKQIKRALQKEKNKNRPVQSAIFKVQGNKADGL